MTSSPGPSSWWPLIRAELQPLVQRPLVCLTIVFILGIVWADLFKPPPAPMIALSLLGLLLTGYAVWRVPAATYKLLLVVGFLMGGTLHGWQFRPVAAALVPPEGLRLAQMEGVVAGFPDHTPSGEQIITLNWKGAAGATLARVRLTVPPKPRLTLARRVTLRGVDLWQLKGVGTPGEVDRDPQLLRYGIHLRGRAEQIARVWGPNRRGGPLEERLDKIRLRLLEVLTEAMPGASAEVYAGLLASMVYGVKVAPVADWIGENFHRSGTSHLLVASGAQVSIIALSLIFLVRGTRRLLPLWGMALISAALVGFALLAGMDVSIMRAVAMGMIMLGTFALGRRYDVATALAVAALALCLLHTALVFNHSAQLTFGCVIGVCVTWPRRVQPGLAGRIRHLFVAAAWGSLGAWLMATPIIVHFFHNMVLFGTLANVIAVPLAAALLYLGILAMIAGLVWLPLAIPLCYVARGLMDVMLASNAFFGSLPLATVDVVYWRWPWFIMWYAAVAVGFSLLRSAPLRQRALACNPRWGIAAATALIGALLLWQAIAQSQPRDLRVSVLDVGPAQCVLVQAPAGNVLIDAGADAMPGRAEQILRRRVLPFMALHRVRRLEAIVISHTDGDHCNLAAPIMQAIPTRRLLLGGDLGAGEDWLRMLQMAHRGGTPIASFQPGAALRLGAHTWLSMLGPLRHVPSDDSAINDNSLVVRLAHEQTAMLLPADIGIAGERALVRDYAGQPEALRADVLLAPHHGSATSNTPTFLQAVSPAAIVVSCGGGNQASCADVLERYQRLGVSVWRTDVDGVISITSDGQKVAIKGYRGRQN